MSVRIVTPSYAPDFELFRSLHESVLRFTGPDVVHEVIVPRRDIALFASIASDRLAVTDVRSLLPRSFVSIRPIAARLAAWTRVSALSKFQEFDPLRPWLPVRGWILQQVVKLAATARAGEDVVVCLDSDVELIAALAPSAFRSRTSVRLFEDPLGVTSDMPNHIEWHRTARLLLGLPAPEQPPLPDYICGMVSWDPVTVRDMLVHVERVAGGSWIRAVTSRMAFSEAILYGTYVRAFSSADTRTYARADSLCASHWEPVELTISAAGEFLESVRASDIAVQVQSTSSTPTGVRRTLIDQASAKVGG